MRYHWSLGIGHIYSHGQVADASAMTTHDNGSEQETGTSHGQAADTSATTTHDNGSEQETSTSHGQVADTSAMTTHDNGFEQETSATPAVYMVPDQPDDENGCEADDPELCAENREDCDLGEGEEGSENELPADDDHDHDELLVALDDMYGPQDVFDVYDS